MAVDLTGGLDPSRDFFLAEVPPDPEFRESASLWVSDQAGQIGLPRIGIEAVAASWHLRGLQVNVGFPDGRAVIVREAGEGRSPADGDGVCRTFAAGGLEFRCVDPFKVLRVTYEGNAIDTTAADMAEGAEGGAPRVPLRIEVEVNPVLPPWVSGTLTADAKELFESGFAGAFVSPRYEQLCRASASVEVGGETWTFEGTGLRIHRQGRRDVSGFWGHCWPSAVFPSGKGFGALAFPERPGQATYNEGFVFDGERMIPATLVGTPWLRRLQPHGEDVSLTLRTAEGQEVHIEGETIFSSCIPGGMVEFAPALQQAGVRYRWDGEEGYGMLERSTPMDQLEA